MNPTFEQERRSPEWFFRTVHDFPLWKRIIWRMLGTKRIGSDDTEEFGRVTVTGYQFRGITYVSSIETIRSSESLT